MHRTLEKLDTAVRAGLGPLDAAAMQARPGGDPARWTIQQTAEHLLMTYTLTCDTFAARLAKGTPTKARATVPQRIGQVVVLTLGSFPKGRQAPGAVVPPASEAPASGVTLAARVTEALGRMDGLAAEAERTFGSQRAISHQVLGPLSVAQWRQFHLVHGLHHLRLIRHMQAER